MAIHNAATVGPFVPGYAEVPAEETQGWVMHVKKIGLHITHGRKQAAIGRVLMWGLIFCMLLSAIPVGAASAVVSLPDTELEDVVRDALDKSDGDITDADMATLNELDADDEEISDLSGLEYAVNLRELDLEDNQVSDLSPLANLTNLQDLDLEDNQVSNLSPLANLTNLQNLDLEDNQVSDLGPLANLTNLQDLDLEDNQVSNISPLVANSEFGSDDSVELQYNYLDLTPGSAAMSDIEALGSRGVEVSYRPQRQ